MRYLHRMSKRERERKGPGLAPHVLFPECSPDPAAEPDPGLSAEDKAALDAARDAMPGIGPAARSRGRNLAHDIRETGGTVHEWLPVLHRLEWAQRHGGTGSSWAHVVATLLVACHELDPRRVPPPVSDEQADKLLRAALDGKPL